MTTDAEKRMVLEIEELLTAMTESERRAFCALVGITNPEEFRRFVLHDTVALRTELKKRQH